MQTSERTLCRHGLCRRADGGNEELQEILGVDKAQGGSLSNHLA